MKSSVLAASIAIMLCACTPPASSDPAANRSDAPDEVPAGPPATTGAGSGTTVEPADDAKAVNDAIDAALGDHTRYQAVIGQLQQAVAAGDAATVAGLVEYPISVDIDGRDTMIEDKDAFVARYDQFMTPEISKAIVDTRYGDLFVNYKGVMFGNGQAWINGICKDDQCSAFDVKVVALQPGPDDPSVD